MRVTEADLPNALRSEIAAAKKAKQDAANADAEDTSTDTDEAVDPSSAKDAITAEMPPEDFPEDEDYQLKRAKEILGKLVLSGSLVTHKG